MSTDPRHPLDERGFALIAAIGLLVVLSVAGLEFSLMVRARSLAAANVSEYGRGRAAALAGAQHVLARLDRLLDGGGQSSTASVDRLLDPWAIAPELLPDTVVLGDARYSVILRDASTRLNLNRASGEDLRRLLSALRVDAGRADRIAQSVDDWRDGDDLHHARGAEREYYLENGRPVLPRNGPFASLDELRHVRDVTPEIFLRVRPYLTLLGSGQINLNAAPRPVLLSLPGMSEEAVAIVLRRRQSRQPLRNLLELSNDLPSGPRAQLQGNLPRLVGLTTFSTHEVEVLSDGWATGSGVHAHVEALIARAGGTALLVWQRSE